MELKQLLYFQKVAHTQNISKAADELFIAQPSLSATIKRLEAEVGMPLFDRVGKTIVLNDAGRIFLKYVNQVFVSLDNADKELKELCNDSDKKVCISIQAASLLLPDIIRKIKEELPDIQLTILQQRHEEAHSSDLQITSDFELSFETASELLLEEPLGIVFPKGSPLALKKNIVKKDLVSESFITLSSKCSLNRIIAYYYEKEHFYPKISTYVDSPNIMRDLLNINQDVAIIPQYSWRNFYEGFLTFRPIDDMPMKRYLTLSYDKERYMTSYVRKCKDLIISCFQEYASII